MPFGSPIPANQLREHQGEAVSCLQEDFREWIREVFAGEKNVKKSITGNRNRFKKLFDVDEDSELGELETSFLLAMATGTGKTITVGYFLHYLIEIQARLRKRFPVDTTKEVTTFGHQLLHRPLSILFLNDQVNILDQLQADFLKGRNGNSPLFGDHALGFSTKKFYDGNGGDSQDAKSQGNATGNTLHVATYQSLTTANQRKEFIDQVSEASVLFIDESDVGSHKEASYARVLKQIVQKSTEKNGFPPFIIPVTATPDEHTIALHGEPIYEYPLASYLASDHSPEVDYKFMHKESDAREIESLFMELEQSKKIKDFIKRKQALRAIEEKIDALLAYGSPEEFVEHLIDDLPSIQKDRNKKVTGAEQTIIFASSIDEAERITDELNKNCPNIASCYTSNCVNTQEAREEVLNNYKNGASPIIVAVDMLNRGIDLPDTKHVVFYRMTESDKIYFQQFGRGLRGLLVHIYDYVGSFRNVSKVFALKKEVQKITKEKKKGTSQPKNGTKETGTEKEKLNIEGFEGTQLASVNIVSLMCSLDEQLYPEYTCNAGESIQIDGVRHWGVVYANQVLGVKGPTIFNHLKKSTTYTGIPAKQKNGQPVTLVPEEFICSLQVDHVCNAGESIKIDGVRHWGVAHLSEVLGVSGKKILYHLKKSTTYTGIPAKQKNGKPVTLVPEEFIRSLQVDHVCNAGESIQIDGMRYLGVTGLSEILGVRGERILKCLKKSDTYTGIPAKQDNGLPITLVPEDFILSLQVEHTCNAGESIEIDGMRYWGVTQKNEVLGIRGFTILNRLKKSDTYTGISAKQENGRSVTLVPEEFILGLQNKQGRS